MKTKASWLQKHQGVSRSFGKERTVRELFVPVLAPERWSRQKEMCVWVWILGTKAETQGLHAVTKSPDDHKCAQIHFSTKLCQLWPKLLREGFCWCSEKWLFYGTSAPRMWEILAIKTLPPVTPSRLALPNGLWAHMWKQLFLTITEDILLLLVHLNAWKPQKQKKKVNQGWNMTFPPPHAGNNNSSVVLAWKGLISALSYWESNKHPY